MKHKAYKKNKTRIIDLRGEITLVKYSLLQETPLWSSSMHVVHL
jgi:hypothetical protein